MRECAVCRCENPSSAHRCDKCGAWLSTGDKPSKSAPPRRELPPADTFDGHIARMLQQGQKIPAIQLYREETGAGLKEAKEAVEAIGREYGIHVRSSGCGGAALVAGVLLVLLITLVRSFVSA